MEQSIQRMAPTVPSVAAKLPARTRVTWWFLVVILGIHAGLAAAQPFLAGAFLKRGGR